jgi:hypothetical protein
MGQVHIHLYHFRVQLRFNNHSNINPFMLRLHPMRPLWFLVAICILHILVSVLRLWLLLWLYRPQQTGISLNPRLGSYTWQFPQLRERSTVYPSSISELLPSARYVSHAKNSFLTSSPIVDVSMHLSLYAKQGIALVQRAPMWYTVADQ